MLKTAVITTVTAAASIAGCQPAPPKPAPAPAVCVVWAAVNASTVDIDPPCDLNLIYPGIVDRYDCEHRGGRLGGMIDTCYDVDY
jgi:hypothetical protein